MIRSSDPPTTGAPGGSGRSEQARAGQRVTGNTGGPFYIYATSSNGCRYGSQKLWTKQKKSKEYNKLALELNKVRRKYMKNYNKLIKLTDKGKQNSSEGEKICSKCIQLRTEYDNLRENLKNI